MERRCKNDALGACASQGIQIDRHGSVGYRLHREIAEDAQALAHAATPEGHDGAGACIDERA
ncbi:MAG: hypothetical protein ACXW36_11180, partial [Nitrospira sp.]